MTAFNSTDRARLMRIEDKLDFLISRIDLNPWDCLDVTIAALHDRGETLGDYLYNQWKNKN